MQPLKVTDLVIGKWPGVLTAFGVPPNFLTGKHGPCPMCGGKDRARFDNKDGRGTFFCSHCGAGDGWKFLKLLKGWDFREAAREVEKIIGGVEFSPVPRREDDSVLRQRMKTAWGLAGPIEPGDIVDRYFRGRGIALEKFPWCLRRDGNFLIAVLSAPDGTGSSILRTELAPDGSKRLTRKFMPGKIAKGSAVRLARQNGILGIAEGIETALSAGILFGIPTWAAGNTTLLTQFQVPDGVEKVVIFGDNDRSFGGGAAAFSLAHRLACGSRKIEISIEIPDGVGTDWNDKLKSHDNEKM